MKKYLLILFVIAGFSADLSAQVEPHYIGIRFGGGNFGGGGEFSYMHGLGDANRLELGLGLNSLNGTSYFRVVGIYQWVWDLNEGFSWYAGPGAQFYAVSNASTVLVGGEVGVEYNFNTNLDTPLQISLDTRPMFNLGDGDGFGWGVHLGIRYTF